MASDVTPELVVALKHKVFMAARDGMAISIFAMLWNLDNEIIQSVLTHYTEEDGQKSTPLIIAARNGEEKVVQVLLSNFHVDHEQTGTVKFEGYVIEGATSLWCAAGAGHFGVVKLLVEHGADVNHPTLTNSTPLRAACFDGRLDIVRYLVQNKADLTIANKYHNTCLMISCYKNHHSVVTFLLEKGANPDSKAHCGATALHFSAECGHFQIVKELIKFGASITENDHKMTPLSVAAECSKSQVVRYLVSVPDCSRVDKIDALELLGASFANDKENYDIAKAYQFLKLAMDERFRDPNNIIRKPYYPPVPAYDSWVECQTTEALEAIEKNHGALHMESLTIRERILGPDNPEVPHPVIFRGAVFADSARFDRCIALWMHAMKLRQRNNRAIPKDLLRFSQVFSQMVHISVKLQFKHVLNVLEHAVNEIDKDVERMGREDEDYLALVDIYQNNIHTCLYLLVIALRVAKTQDECWDLHQIVYKFLRLKPVLKNGYTTLHMAVDSSSIVDDFHVNDVVRFPNASLTAELVRCGADVDARDQRGNTPLHIIVRYTNPIDDFDTLHQIILTLIRGDAHLDIRNSERNTPMQSSTTGVAEVILRQHHRMSLKCLAASSVRNNNINYKNFIPQILEEFILLH